MYILVHEDGRFQVVITVKTAKCSAKWPLRTKSAMNLMELEAKVLRNPQIHMYRNLSDCV